MTAVLSVRVKHAVIKAGAKASQRPAAKGRPSKAGHPKAGRRQRLLPDHSSMITLKVEGKKNKETENDARSSPLY